MNQKLSSIFALLLVTMVALAVEAASFADPECRADAKAQGYMEEEVDNIVNIIKVIHSQSDKTCPQICRPFLRDFGLETSDKRACCCGAKVLSELVDTSSYVDSACRADAKSKGFTEPQVANIVEIIKVVHPRGDKTCLEICGPFRKDFGFETTNVGDELKLKGPRQACCCGAKVLENL